MQSHAGRGREFVFGEEKRGWPCKHLFIFGRLWNAVREEELSVYKAIQWDSPAKDGRRSRVVCYLKCFISMSKSVAFLYLPSRFPTMHGRQGFVYRKETRGLVQCYQFFCSSLLIVMKSPPPVCHTLFLQTSTPLKEWQTNAFLFGVGTPKKSYWFLCFEIMNCSGQK